MSLKGLAGGYVTEFCLPFQYLQIFESLQTADSRCKAVVDMKADMEAETVYYGRPGHRPLSIACNEGCMALEVVGVAWLVVMDARKILLVN